MIKKLWLPRCYLPEVKGENRLEYPYKELLIWAVLSKKYVYYPCTIKIQTIIYAIVLKLNSFLCSQL